MKKIQITVLTILMMLSGTVMLPPAALNAEENVVLPTEEFKEAEKNYLDIKERYGEVLNNVVLSEDYYNLEKKADDLKLQSDKANAELLSAEKEKNTLEKEYKDINSLIKSLNGEIQVINGKEDVINNELENISNDYNNAVLKKEAADKNLSNRQAAFDSKSEEVEALQKEYDDAYQNYQNILGKYTDESWQSDKNKAYQLMEEAFQKYDAAIRRYNLGSYGFFKSQGAREAMAVLDYMTSDAITKGYEVVLGAKDDATNLELMKLSIELIEVGNKLRANDDVIGPSAPLKVTHTMMALAQANIEHQKNEINHWVYSSSTNDVNVDDLHNDWRTAENLAWGYELPKYVETEDGLRFTSNGVYRGWYDDEKKIYVQAINNNSEPNMGKVGHYVNLTNGNYGITGVAIAEIDRMKDFKGRLAYSQEFNYENYLEKEFEDYEIYTVDEYRDIFNDYYFGIHNELETTESDYLNKLNDYNYYINEENNNTELNNAKTAYENAEKKLNKALDEKETLQTALDNAKTDVQAINEKYEIFANEYDGLCAALDELKTHDDELNTQLSELQKNKEELYASYQAKEKNYNDLLIKADETNRLYEDAVNLVKEEYIKYNPDCDIDLYQLRKEYKQAENSYFSIGGGKITVKYVLENGTKKADYITPMTERFVPEAYEDDGYAFAGWYLDSEYNNRIRYLSGLSYSDGDEIILYGKTCNEYININYELSGLDDKYNQNVRKLPLCGDTIDLLPLQSDGSFYFAGWYLDSLYKNEVSEIRSNGSAQETVKLYAKIVTDTFDIELISQEETAVYKSFVDIPVEMKECPFNKEGYRFVGWKLVSDNETVYFPGFKYTFDAGKDEKLVLEAIWEKINTVEVFFDGNGADTSEKEPLTVYYGQSILLNDDGLYKKGYSLVGFNSKADGSGDVYSLNEWNKIASSEDTLTLYAIWKANSYTVDFDANGGVISFDQKSVVYNEKFGDLPSVINGTAKFVGWFEGNKQFNADSIMEYDHDIILKAKWSYDAKLPKVDIRVNSSELFARRAVLTINSGVPGTRIYYTTDGSIPTSQSGILYNGPVTLEFSREDFDENYNELEINAIASKDGYVDSDNTVYHYSIYLLDEYYEDPTFVGLADKYEFTGKPIKPAFGFYYKDQFLYAGKDYSVSYKNNTKPGIATITVKGKGNYSGTYSTTFEIFMEESEKIHASKFSVKFAACNYWDLVSERYNGITVKYGKQILTEGIDYSVEYPETILPGDNTIKIHGMGEFYGYTTAVLKTAKYDLSLDGGLLVALYAYYDSNDDRTGPYVSFSKNGAKPLLIYMQFVGMDMEEKVDYTVSYQNNKKLGTGRAVIKGKGRFTGTIYFDYPIKEKDIKNLDIETKDVTYSKKKGNWKSTVKILDGGKALSSKEISSTEYTYYNDTYIMDYSSKIPVRKFKKAGEVIKNTDCLPAGAVVNVTVTAKEGSGYKGSRSGQYRITQKSISSAKTTISGYVYDGGPFAPDKDMMIVKVGKDILNNSDYEIISYSNNISKGSASLTIKGVGMYGGVKTFKFKIDARKFPKIIN